MTKEHNGATLRDPESIARARASDRSAGRWCGACAQYGSHHTDRHDDFARKRDDTFEAYLESEW